MGRRMDNFWKQFEKTMEGLGDAIDEMADEDLVLTRSKVQKYSSSKSVTVQNGNKVVVSTVNGKTKVTVNGKEYTPKEKK